MLKVSMKGLLKYRAWGKKFQVASYFERVIFCPGECGGDEKVYTTIGDKMFLWEETTTPYRAPLLWKGRGAFWKKTLSSRLQSILRTVNKLTFSGPPRPAGTPPKEGNYSPPSEGQGWF